MSAYAPLTFRGHLGTRGALPAGEVIALVALGLTIAARNGLLPGVGVGHEKLGSVASFLDYDWIAAERSFRRALQCNPENLQIRSVLAYDLPGPLARTQETQVEVKTILRLSVNNGPSQPVFPFRAHRLASAFNECLG